MNIAKLEIYRLVNWLLPIRKRKPKIKAILKVCVFPIKKIYQELLAYRQEKIDQLQYTGQVIYLERLLNNRFNEGNPGIYIRDGSEIDEVIMYNKSENHIPVYLCNKAELDINDPSYDPNAIFNYLYNRGEYNSGFDFKIYIPAGISYNSQKMDVLICRYKMAGKRYQIINL